MIYIAFWNWALIEGRNSAEVGSVCRALLNESELVDSNFDVSFDSRRVCECLSLESRVIYEFFKIAEVARLGAMDFFLSFLGSYWPTLMQQSHQIMMPLSFFGLMIDLWTHK
jgi:hypothetical protein